MMRARGNDAAFPLSCPVVQRRDRNSGHRSNLMSVEHHQAVSCNSHVLNSVSHREYWSTRTEMMRHGSRSALLAARHSMGNAPASAVRGHQASESTQESLIVNKPRPTMSTDVDRFTWA